MYIEQRRIESDLVKCSRGTKKVSEIQCITDIEGTVKSRYGDWTYLTRKTRELSEAKYISLESRLALMQQDAGHWHRTPLLSPIRIRTRAGNSQNVRASCLFLHFDQKISLEKFLSFLARFNDDTRRVFHFCRKTPCISLIVFTCYSRYCQFA